MFKNLLLICACLFIFSNNVFSNNHSISLVKNENQSSIFDHSTTLISAGKKELASLASSLFTEKYSPSFFKNISLLFLSFFIFLIGYFLWRKKYPALWITLFIFSDLLKVLTLKGLPSNNTRFFILTFGIELFSFLKIFQTFLPPQNLSKKLNNLVKAMPPFIILITLFNLLFPNLTAFPLIILWGLFCCPLIFIIVIKVLLKLNFLKKLIALSLTSSFFFIFFHYILFKSQLSMTSKFLGFFTLWIFFSFSLSMGRKFVKTPFFLFLKVQIIGPYLLTSFFHSLSLLQIVSFHDDISNLNIFSGLLALISFPLLNFELYKFKDQEKHQSLEKTTQMMNQYKIKLEKDLQEKVFRFEMQAMSLEDMMDHYSNQKKLRDKILNCLQQGILTFDSHGIILDGANNISQILLETNLFESEAKRIKIGTILNLPPEKKEIFKNAFYLFFQNKMSFKNLETLLPKKFKGTRNRDIHLEFIPILENRTKIVENIILLLSDKTIELKLAKEVKNREYELEMEKMELEYMMDHIYEHKVRRDQLIEHLQNGYLTFNQDGIIEEGANKVCEQLLETSFFESEVRGKQFCDIFNGNEQKKRFLKKWVKTIFEGAFQFKDLMDLAPKTFKGTQNKHIKLVFRPIYHLEKKNKIQKVIMIVIDKTKEKELEDKIKRDKEEAFFIKLCLQNPEGFLELMNDTYSFLFDYPTIENYEEEKERIFRYVHTMKARYGQFHLSDIAQILNELEDSLEKNDWDQLNTKMKRLDQITRTFFIKHRLLVQAANKLLLEEKSAITLKDLKSELNNFSSIQKLKDHINKTYIYQDFKIAFKKYEPLIDELSHEQGKSILLEIRGDEIFVDKDFYSSFIQSSIHIFRNIVDHGIESPEERQKKNKPEMASIVVKTIKKKNNILLIIEDDGRGIDPEKIKSKAIEKGLKSPQEINSMSHRKVLDLIFLPGFSTKNQVNQISGRGVGTDAVRFEVEKLKGTILVESKLGIKTIFTITLPILTEFNS